MKRTLLQTLLIASGFITLNGVFAQEPVQAIASPAPTATTTATTVATQTFAIPDPVATVAGKPLSKAEFEKFAAPLVGGNLEVFQEAGQVNNLIDAYVLQKALSEKAITDKLDQTEKFKAAMAQIRINALAEAYITKYAEGVKVKVTDAEIKAEYDKQFAAIDKKEFKAAHILVEKEEEAKKVLAELTNAKAPIKFADAAKKYSKDTGSATNGGDLGWFRPQMMVPEFSKAVATLKKGEMTKTAVKSQFGYHIIVLEDERATPVDSLETSEERIKQAITELKTRAYIENMQKDLKIEHALK